MGFLAANSGEVPLGPPRVDAVVCADWATDTMLDPASHPVTDEVAARGIEDATVSRVRMPGRTVGKVACRVSGCKVACQIIGLKGPGVYTGVTKVESLDDETGFDHCVRHPLSDSP